MPFQDELAGTGYRDKLEQKYLVWDNASTHGAVRVSTGKRQSFWHLQAQKIGLKGAIFLPP